MGSWFSHPRNEVDEADSTHPAAFRYPPKSGNYFGSHFIMGGERFETPQPEQYLFGENCDLNFLGSKPVPFPYPAPQTNEPTKTLKALVNIRKESLKFVKVITPAPIPDTSVPEEGLNPANSNTSSPTVSVTTPSKISYLYNIEFTFDCDCRVEITIMYFCTEEFTANGIIYKPRDPKLNSETVRFKAGANQSFSQSDHIVRPSTFPESDLQFDFDKEVYPIVIHCVALEGDEPRQSHTTTAIMDKHGDGTYVIKPLKQKLFVDGLAYLLQEIYGIENKNSSRKAEDDDSDENASECVICMSDVRDTIILPCRHLCLCHSCADSLRYQANNCPICRAPFRALLQIRAVYRIPPMPMEYNPLPPEMPIIQMNAIPGYEMVPLLEALNGPYQPSEYSAVAAAHEARRQEAARALNPNDESGNNTPIAMTVMVAPQKPEDIDKDKLGSEAMTVISETDKKDFLFKMSSMGMGDVRSPSEPEDEEHFSEAPGTDDMPDLEDFTRSSSVTNPGLMKSQFSLNDHEDENALQLQSIESNQTNLSMIAAIDEFSDEEETTTDKRIIVGGMSEGLKSLPDSCPDSTQSTPVRMLSCRDSVSGTRSGGGSGGRYKSLPTTPRLSASAPAVPGTATSTSTRSSGDSFTSSSSTKQLLPPHPPTPPHTSLH